ncbi:ABC transporter ATP-binding protein [Spiroplasma clarkii]|uniref:ABC transporter ATP-binding protein n=1 Tax=Spiroplasma clarkii TaxID=2139 RepID=UPI002FE24D05
MEIENLEIKKDCIIGLVGMNGSGKTILMKSIFNLIRFNKGQILIDGDNLFKQQNLKRIAFFPDQNTVPLDLTVQEYWQYIATLVNLSTKEFKIKEEKSIKLTKLEKLYKKTIKQLSSGEKKRAIMGSVLLTEPELIFFDEPTANLDINATAEMLEIIKQLSSIGVGIFITSHDAEEMQDLINHLVLIKDGKILYDQAFDKGKEKLVDIYKSFYKNQDAINPEYIKDIYAKN